MSSLPRKLSAVIACYRDAPTIRPMHQRLQAVFRKLGVDYEIIFVNDASPDEAGEILAALAAEDSRVTVITHTRNFGSQSAFTSGMRVATGDALILLDGDLQDPPEVIEQFYERWQEGWDVVYGQRVRRDASLAMQLSYKVFYRVFRSLSYVQIPVDAGDFLRGLRAWVGFRQVGVPYVRPERPYGRSTNSLFRNLGWARKAILSFSYTPLDLIVWIALTTVGASVVGMATQIALRIAAPDLVPKGFTTLLIVVLFVGGIQLLCLSIIGSYLAHVYDEVKRRPAYIVESVLNPPARPEPEELEETVPSEDSP